MNKESTAQDSNQGQLMKAARVHKFGGIDAIIYENVSVPVPEKGQVLIRVKAAGVGPWDAWVRAGKSAVPQPLPLTLGSDLSGVIEVAGPGVSAFNRGDEVFGVTNTRFTGACAEFAVADASMTARRPNRLSYVEAASVPVVAVTAWQMVFDHGQVDDKKRVLVHGGAGNVGAYAVQLAKGTGARVFATAFTHDIEYVYSIGADRVINARTERFEEEANNIDVVIDTIGGDTLNRSFDVLVPGGVLVSSATVPDKKKAAQRNIRAVFFLVNVTSQVLIDIASMLESGQLRTNVGEVLPLSKIRLAHEMLAGMPHKRGKIVLTLET